jgi:hypothetical protein
MALELLDMGLQDIAGRGMRVAYEDYLRQREVGHITVGIAVVPNNVHLVHYPLEHVQNMVLADS